jgi:aromatic-L-amino-acid/L-tryptophan decarboxylase
MLDIPEPVEMPSYLAPEHFRTLGHELVDRIADFLARLPSMPVTPNESPTTLRALLPPGGLPKQGSAADALLAETANLLFAHSLFNGHPRFFGYISSSPAPVGMLADLLAAAVNPNVAIFVASPVATEIESQTLRWIAEVIGYRTDCGGVLTSGGNMANFVCLLAARTHHLGQTVREQGIAGGGRRLRIYVSVEAHNWVQRSADLCGLGSDAIHWIPADGAGRITVDAVRTSILADRE